MADVRSTELDEARRRTTGPERVASFLTNHSEAVLLGYCRQRGDEPPSYELLSRCVSATAASLDVPMSTHESKEVAHRISLELAEAIWRIWSRQDEALKLERGRLNTIMTVTFAGLFIADAAGSIVQANETAAQIYGGSLTDPATIEYAISRAWRPDTGVLLGVEESGLMRAVDRRESSSGEEIDIVTLDGARKTLLTSAAPILDGDRVLGSASAVLDVTDRRRHAEAKDLLVRAGAALGGSLDTQSAIQALTDLVVPGFADWCSLELFSGDRGQLHTVAIRHVDPRLANVASQLRRAHPSESLASTQLGQLMRSGEAFLRNEPHGAGDVERSEPRRGRTHEARFAGGERRGAEPHGAGEWLENEPLQPFRELGVASYIIVPLAGPDEPLGVMSIVYGHSGRRYDDMDLETARTLGTRISFALQNALLLERTREAVRAREEAIATLSHDLKNPLQVVQMAASNLRTMAASGKALVVDDVTKMAAAILRAGGSMTRLITDLLDLSRLEAGQYRLDKASVSISELVESACEASIPLARNKDMSLVAEVPEDGTISCDRERILQVFSNLIGNAIKFAPPSTKITVGSERGDLEQVFWVRDQGPGIHEEQIPRLFDRYWQAPDASRRGTGLGLVIAKNIVEAHGGTIWAESRIGAGTTFRFTLPYVTN